VLDKDTVRYDWAGQILEEIRVAKNLVLLRATPWMPVNADSSEWFIIGKEAIEASPIDQLAALYSRTQYDAYQEALRTYTLLCHKENQWISGGEVVRVAIKSAEDALLEAFIKEEDMRAYAADPERWERHVWWFQGVVVGTPRSMNGEFKVAIQHGPHCRHEGTSCEEVPWECAYVEDGDQMMYEWTAIRRLKGEQR
jgi:hypothetical protein